MRTKTRTKTVIIFILLAGNLCVAAMGCPCSAQPASASATVPSVEAATGPVTLSAVEYCAGHEYRNGVLERVHNDYGYWAGGRYHYYIKDYQGNVRAVIDEEGRLEEVNNYYPYGGLMGAAGSGVQPRKYGGKELDRENGLDWYDSQARHYPTITRFITMDPMAEKYYSASPYSYCHGNPINRIDPNGAEISLNKAIENKVCDAETISQYVSRLNAAFIGIATFNYDITNNMVIRSLSLPDVVITLTK